MVRAHRGLPTPEVFKTLDALRETENNATGIEPAPLSQEDQSALLGDAISVAPVLSNDLTAPALHLYPELAGTIRDARAAGACAAILSGSGPTIAVLARDKAHADELAGTLARSSEVSATLPTSGPALGAIVEEEEC
jgi:4-(cytidine 5'-diphospho)-2-C-methyl-D-erythritol kinase